MKRRRDTVPGALVAALSSMSVLGAAMGTQDLENLWPHPPGATWSYDRVAIEWGALTKSEATTVRFTLGDSTTVGGGISVQPLSVEVAGATAGQPATFWRQLAAARPDVATALAGATPDGASSGLVIHDAGLVRVAADEIAAYRDSPAIRSWLYAETNLAPGHSFRLQLIPDLADSVFLDGSVLGAADVTTPAGSFAAALRLRYDVDYGWADAHDSLGAVVGRVRARTRGEMFYAPGVGPVLARETFVPHSESQGNPPPPPVDSTFAELRLLTYSLEPSAVQTRSWTQVKRAYR